MKIIIEDAEFEPVKLLVVDDSWVLRRVLRGTLSQREEIQIVGEATNGVEALDLVLKLQPDVILLDVEMPVMDGLTTLQHLMIHTPTPVIMLSSLSKWGSPRCFDALKYGATDFVSKNIFFQDIAFKIVNREWEYSYKRGFRCQFQNNIFQLWFHFKRYRYRR